MITIKQLRDFLAEFPDDYKVIWMDGSEIKHIGMSGDACDNIVILADEIEYRQCLRCGCDVFTEKDSQIDYPFYCPCCDENKYEFETKIIDREHYSNDTLQKIRNDFEKNSIDCNGCITEDFFLWQRGTDVNIVLHWFDENKRK